MVFGLVLFAISLWRFTPITHDWGWQQLLLPQALRGFSQQFAVAPIVTLTLGGLAPERLKLASGLFNLMRNLGGAIGIAACGTLLNDRTNLHFLRLAEQVNQGNSAVTALLARMAARGTTVFNGDTVHGQAAAIQELASLLMREALTETFADTFLVIAVCIAVAALMAPLMRKVAPPKGPSAEAH
jgi:DHA2 family multidrug resistance protein